MYTHIRISHKHVRAHARTQKMRAPQLGQEKTQSEAGTSWTRGQGGTHPPSLKGSHRANMEHFELQEMSIIVSNM